MVDLVEVKLGNILVMVRAVDNDFVSIGNGKFIGDNPDFPAPLVFLPPPHPQLVLIPRQTNRDPLVREPIMNVVEDNNFFVTYCPDFSQWPYEVWIAPKKEGTVYGDTADEELKDLSVILQNALKKLKVKYHDQTISKSHTQMPFSYNFYIHHAKNWFLRIIPRLVHRAGFELGTGLSVNVIDPTIAAEELKAISI